MSEPKRSWLRRAIRLIARSFVLRMCYFHLPVPSMIVI